jgi:hypothetical protein
MFPRLARHELLGFEHAEGFPQCAEALIELPVEIHLARQKPKLQAQKAALNATSAVSGLTKRMSRGRST